MSSLPACQQEQSGHVGAHTPEHTMSQPELNSDKLGVVGGQESNQLGQTFLAFARDMNQ